MSDNSPSRPLTRREIREREQAAAAAQSGSPAPAPAFAPAPGTSTTSRFPAPSAASPPSTPSRRSLREQGGGAAPPAPAPVVRPPSSSAGVRGLDETGRLAPIQRPTGELSRAVAPAPPARPAPSAPSTPAPAPFRSSARQAPAAPAGMALPPLAEPPVTHVSPPAATPPATVAPRPDGPARRSPFPTTGTSTTGTAVGAVPPFGAASAPAKSAAPSAPALPWATTGTGSSVGERPASVPPTRRPSYPQPDETAVHDPAPARPAASPFDSLVASEQPVRARSAAPVVDEDDDEDWEEPEASYTWLHYIVLVVVAFVLGLLLWKLLLDGPDTQDFTTDAAPAAPTLTYEHPGAAA